MPELLPEILDALWLIDSDKEPLPPDKIRFACPHCFANIRASKDKAGTQAKCPKCQLPFKVPIPKGVLREPSPLQTEVTPVMSAPLASPACSDDFSSRADQPAQPPGRVGSSRSPH